MNALRILFKITRWVLMILALVWSIESMLYLMNHGYHWVFTAWFFFVLPGLFLPFFTSIRFEYLFLWIGIIVLSMLEYAIEQRIESRQFSEQRSMSGSSGGLPRAVANASWDAGVVESQAGRAGKVFAFPTFLRCVATRVRVGIGFASIEESATIDWADVQRGRFEDLSEPHPALSSKRVLILEVGPPWFYFILIEINTSEEERTWKSLLAEQGIIVLQG